MIRAPKRAGISPHEDVIIVLFAEARQRLRAESVQVDPSLRAKRSNPEAGLPDAGLLRRPFGAPRNDGPDPISSDLALDSEPLESKQKFSARPRESGDPGPKALDSRFRGNERSMVAIQSERITL